MKKEKAVAILRTSESNNVIRQLNDINDYARKKNLEVAHFFGRNKTLEEKYNPHFEALEYCEDNQDVKYLLVTDNAVISRDYGEYILWLEKFRSRGMQVISTSDTFINSPEKNFINSIYSLIEQNRTERDEKA